jgi:hypothetical protein
MNDEKKRNESNLPKEPQKGKDTAKSGVPEQQLPFDSAKPSPPGTSLVEYENGHVGF